MQFLIGTIIGLLISILFFVILSYFRISIENRIESTKHLVESKSPEQKGAIFLAPDESDIAREEHIANNKKQGKDTPLSELM